MSSKEYISDLKTRSVELEYEYWTIKVETAKREQEAQEKIIKKLSEQITDLIEKTEK